MTTRKPLSILTDFCNILFITNDISYVATGYSRHRFFASRVRCDRGQGHEQGHQIISIWTVANNNATSSAMPRPPTTPVPPSSLQAIPITIW